MNISYVLQCTTLFYCFFFLRQHIDILPFSRVIQHTLFSFNFCLTHFMVTLLYKLIIVIYIVHSVHY